MIYDNTVCGGLAEELRPGGLSLTQEMIDLAALPPGAAILDVGCGAGKSVLALCEWGYAAHGIDASPQLVQKGRALGADIALGEATALTGYYDALLYECTMSVFEDRATALSAARAALRTGGKLLLSDLYLRKGQASTLPGLTCFNGVLPWPKIHSSMEESGFSLCRFIDKTTCYREFVATMIMEYGSLQNFFSQFTNNYENAGQFSGLPYQVKLGYFISVWQKHTCR